ncbi:MAG: TIGR02996 domain-containing protein [Proteobacteria bacterium]|nr:TIGR02996 domain-containing protein [Pseudomonadota bacterium]
MVIVVIEHAAGWRDHVVVDRDVVTIGRAPDNDVVLGDPQLAEHHTTLEARALATPVRFGEFTLVGELVFDPIEAALLTAIAGGDGPSLAVYADWLDEHDRHESAEFLRVQRALLTLAPTSSAFAELATRLRAVEEGLPYGWRSHLTRPVIELGEPTTLAFRIGLERPDAPTSRLVEIWAAGIELTCDDNEIHVPSFVHAIERAASWARRPRGLPFPDLDVIANHRRIDDDEELRDRYRWLDTGPTTDNLSCFLFLDGEDAIVTFAFWRQTHPRPHELGQVFAIRLPGDELRARLQQLVRIL